MPSFDIVSQVNSMEIENALNIALAFPLYKAFGVPGLAVAFAGAYGGASVLTIVVLRRRLGYIDGRRLVDTLTRSLAAGLLVANSTASRSSVAAGMPVIFSAHAGVLRTPSASPIR